MLKKSRKQRGGHPSSKSSTIPLLIRGRHPSRLACDVWWVNWSNIFTTCILSAIIVFFWKYRLILPLPLPLYPPPWQNMKKYLDPIWIRLGYDFGMSLLHPENSPNRAVLRIPEGSHFGDPDQGHPRNSPTAYTSRILVVGCTWKLLFIIRCYQTLKIWLQRKWTRETILYVIGVAEFESQTFNHQIFTVWPQRGIKRDL